MAIFFFDLLVLGVFVSSAIQLGHGLANHHPPESIATHVHMMALAAALMYLIRTRKRSH